MSTLPGLPHMGVYRTIAADPAWLHNSAWVDERNGAASAHYDCLSFEDMASMPVGALAHPDGAVLAMWCTGAMGAEGQHTALGRAWGFEPVTLLFDWTKVCEMCVRCGHAWDQHVQQLAPHLPPGPCAQLHARRIHGVCECEGFVCTPDPGCGSYTMQEHEQVWLFRRGGGWSKNRARRNVRQTILHPLPGGEHSRKPEVMQDLLEALWPEATPRLELFARRNRPGWACWGNETPEPTLVFGETVGTTWPGAGHGSGTQPQPRGEAQAVQHGLGVEDPAAGLDSGLPWWAP